MKLIHKKLVNFMNFIFAFLKSFSVELDFSIIIRVHLIHFVYLHIILIGLQ